MKLIKISYASFDEICDSAMYTIQLINNDLKNSRLVELPPISRKVIKIKKKVLLSLIILNFIFYEI